MLSHEDRLRQALRVVTTGGILSRSEAETVVDSLMQVCLEDSRFASLASGLLCAMKTRGEDAEEIFGAARCLKRHQIALPTGGGAEPLLDTCGTGGDEAHLINVSTLAALVVASLGVRVAKHGNRSISSACGSADLLEALGYPLTADPAQVAGNVASSGFGFLFAPHFHPALKNLASLRRNLGVRTIFNLLGPLVNPAGVTHQLIGVFSRDLLEPMARACGRLGLQKGLLVHGEGGLDELSPFGITWVVLCEGETLSQWEWTPASFGAPSVALDSLRGGDAAENAAITRELLSGGRPEVAAAVSMNAAAALWLAEAETDLKLAYSRSYEALRSGQVGRYFETCKAEANRSKVKALTRSDIHSV